MKKNVRINMGAKQIKQVRTTIDNLTLTLREGAELVKLRNPP